MPTPSCTPADPGRESISARIAIAGFQKVYSTGSVENALDELPPSASDALRATYEKMLKAGGERLSVKPGTMPDFDALEQELPNFGEVLDDLRKQMALCLETQDPLELAPMLLLGEPGIGKTHFARRLSALLGTGFGFVPMSSLTAGWILSGASSQWKNARTGKVFDTLVHGDYANPVMVVDEIDKASGDTQYDPLGALYSLLEHDTARAFVDEFAEVPLDCSEMIWIATANDAARIPDPILNRMNVYEVPAPDLPGRAGSRRTCMPRSARRTPGARPSPTSSSRRSPSVGSVAPREMRRTLMRAFGNAKLAGRSELETADLTGDRSMRRQRIGF